tara:strand:+ start:36 stop:518 length:483 start_codon:yes stop_codon:yes gene_type:complete
MDKKYINFYKKFILQTKTPNDGGVDLNRELKNIFLFLLFFSSFIIQASPINFDCSVKKVSVFDEVSKDNKQFIDSNLKKRFIISVDEQEIIVTSISDTFKSSIKKYTIFSKSDIFNTVSAVSDNSFSTDIIVINPKKGTATISLQGDFYLNAWLLDCKKQ